MTKIPCGADYIVDVGPGAGVHGGYITAQGTYDEIVHNPASPDRAVPLREKVYPDPRATARAQGLWLTVQGASEHNLQNIDVAFPLGVFCVVTGVSGSGKSSLVNGILYNHLAKVLNRAKTRAGKFKDIRGVAQLDKIIAIDQSPIGRTPRNNPATYTGLFDLMQAVCHDSGRENAGL